MNQDNNKKDEAAITEIVEENAATPTDTTTLQEEIDRLKDQWIRAVAEAENVRKRAQKEREDALKFAATSFARDMLSVSDNLRRALECCPQDNDLSEAVTALIAGVEMTEKELLTIFERQGIKPINPLNEKFNPNFHQAMFEIENNEVASGTILQVLQQGYVIHDRLLRPALVAVAKAGSDQGGKSETIA